MAMIRRTSHTARLLATVAWFGCSYQSSSGSRATVPPVDEQKPVAVLRRFDDWQTTVRSRNPAVRLGIERDPTLPNEAVLTVDYPARSDDPASRDIWCTVDRRDWTSGRGIVFRVKTAHPTKLSVSFVDRNRVAYTTWVELPDTTWQRVRIQFDIIRPNPYFQPPGAKVGQPIDVSDVDGIGFAPQDAGPGRLRVSQLILSK